MNIAEKIKAVFEAATGLSLYYGTREEINRVIGYGQTPCGFFTLINSSSVVADGGTITEEIDINLAVVEVTHFDAQSYDNETIIERCKKKCFDFVRATRNGELVFYKSLITSERLYDEFDDIVTGYSVSVRLTDAVPYACGQQDHELFEEVTVDPATFSQMVVADDGYLALSKVTVNAVTASIDENIQPENIRDGVSILGVSGTLAPQSDVNWGEIGGEITDQTDLVEALGYKQDTLVSGTNIKTVNGETLLGSGNIEIQGGGAEIDDTTIALDKVWSSEKTSTSIIGLIDDTDIWTDKVWSSNKVQSAIDAKLGAIDDLLDVVLYGDITGIADEIINGSEL